MIKIVAVMCVVGDPMYFKFASHSIPSFLRNNINTDLRVFTDKPEEIKQYLQLSDKIGIVDIEDYFESHPKEVEKFKSKGRTYLPDVLQNHKKAYGYIFRDVYPATMPLMAEELLRNDGYTHILKIDSESYFAGGNMMAMVEKEVESASHIEVFLVERKHPAMAHYGGGVPGSGFTLWRTLSRFTSEYYRTFDGSQQVTILAMRFSGRVFIEILTRPGYHFVRPFWKARETGKEFTKEMASQFLPAYFHLHGKIALEGYEKLEEWFGERTLK